MLSRHALVYLSFYLSGKSGSPVVRSNHSLSRFFNSQVRLLSPCMHTGKRECDLRNGSTWAIRARSVAHSGHQMALQLHRWGDTAMIKRQ